ncbi:MAG: adenylosuccinate lyase [Bacteroidota bacterium]
MNTLSELSAVSPVDGRYRRHTQSLSDYFSEYALMRYRVLVEVEYFIALIEVKLPTFNGTDLKKETLQDIYRNFTFQDAEKIKATEKITNHDVKAVEYFVKEKVIELGYEHISEYIHFGLTSQDINNTAIPKSILDFLNDVYFIELNSISDQLFEYSKDWKDIAMLARTHGQPASPTRLGKEIYVFVERMVEQIKQLKQIPISSKFGGATGNFNAHHVAFPQINWVDFANQFVNDKLGLSRSQTTTQIEHYDNLASLFDAIQRINTILIDLCRDIWTYVSMDYFKQKIKAGEVGSSAMPHKVNPIDFENAEGNLGMANALLEHMARKLPVSRLQRDLTDSTVLRNLGPAFGYVIIAFKSIQKGLSKLELNAHTIAEDLEDNWAVIAEAIQTVLRRENYEAPYEKLKDLTRKGSKISQADFSEFIDNLEIEEAIKNELKSITPSNYTGIDFQK